MKLGEEEEMTSDCSSGCQSGWTVYLEQSSNELHHSSFQHEEEEEEEDMSMVSDASSGPPLFFEEDEQHCRCYKRSNTCLEDTGCPSSGAAPTAAMARDVFKKRRVEREQQKENSSVLVDTASSPLFSYSKTRFNDNNYGMKPFMEGVLDFSCSFSYAHLEKKSALQKQMGYLQSFTNLKPTPASPVSGKQGKKIW